MADKRPYAKIDTGYMLNPKWFKLEHYLRSSERIDQRIDIRNVVRTARESHLASILYCAQNVTDGIFPVEVVKALATVRPDEEEAITALFEAGLWINEKGGMARVHDYLEHQTSSQKVKQLSEAGKTAAEARKTTNRSTNRSTEEKRREEKVTTNVVTSRASEILDHLDAAIVANGAKAPSRSKKNIDAARLLLDKDGHTVEQVKAAIDYATCDEFWRANILSMSKLRDKYDQLRLSAQRGRTQTAPARNRVQDNLAVVQRIAAKEQAQQTRLEITP